jgi:hypothetical protein
LFQRAAPDLKGLLFFAWVQIFVSHDQNVVFGEGGEEEVASSEKIE